MDHKNEDFYQIRVDFLQNQKLRHHFFSQLLIDFFSDNNIS
ncbi:hypothetical protein XBI1_410014 [Xenorhabdus bovienii str. Intermedium]|uniref:Uncharacterized protein n=1 Tax=Xenorhabdus bovienii str. Intermedium TaxID=1379677 RepID=A0A077QME2_XENBV|nr:hypothetical protein XBI1_410014 [Xenorhabdus bovienii str. Intermedium]